MNEQPPTPEPPDMSEFSEDELLMLEWLASAYQHNSTTEQLETLAERQADEAHKPDEPDERGEAGG